MYIHSHNLPILSLNHMTRKTLMVAKVSRQEWRAYKGELKAERLVLVVFRMSYLFSLLGPSR